MKEINEFENILKDCLQASVEDEVYKIKDHLITKKKKGGLNEYYNKLKENEAMY